MAAFAVLLALLHLTPGASHSCTASASALATDCPKASIPNRVNPHEPIAKPAGYGRIPTNTGGAPANHLIGITDI